MAHEHSRWIRPRTAPLFVAHKVTIAAIPTHAAYAIAIDAMRVARGARRARASLRRSLRATYAARGRQAPPSDRRITRA